jgi:ABC-type transport system involved in multi-copper enzyme maturation permease subunit
MTAAAPSALVGARAVVGFAFAESLRRRVFAVVGGLTVLFWLLYGVGAAFAFNEIETRGLIGSDFIDEQILVGSTLLGLAMFATLFLGAVLAIFLTIGVVRGDADTGLLQPLVVRPLGRATMLVARWAGAAAASAVYVLVVYGVALVITLGFGDWTPDHLIAPGVLLALAVAIIAAVSVLVSVYLSATAQGIAVFMFFGAGLVVGLLGQIGEALNSERLTNIADATTYLVPFEALYQHGLHLLTSDTTGLTNVAVELGPFGGAQEASVGSFAFAAAYTAVVLALAVRGFARRDL